MSTNSQLQSVIEKLTSVDSRLQTIAAQGGYVHTQDVPATQWIVIHHLGRSPGVFAMDDSGNIIEFDNRSDPNSSTAVLNFSSAVAGKATCS
jgi:hypothetical protein